MNLEEEYKKVMQCKQCGVDLVRYATKFRHKYEVLDAGKITWFGIHHKKPELTEIICKCIVCDTANVMFLAR